jgi:hypothetical protein
MDKMSSHPHLNLPPSRGKKRIGMRHAERRPKVHHVGLEDAYALSIPMENIRSRSCRE